MKRNRLISQNKVDIENILREWFSSEVSSDDGIFTKKIQDENRKVIIIIVEDFYYRIDSTLTLTVIAEEADDNTNVDIISSGGKTGFFALSWGSEKSAVKRVVKLLKEHGFEEIK